MEEKHRLPLFISHLSPISRNCVFLLIYLYIQRAVIVPATPRVSHTRPYRGRINMASLSSRSAAIARSGAVPCARFARFCVRQLEPLPSRRNIAAMAGTAALPPMDGAPYSNLYIACGPCHASVNRYRTHRKLYAHVQATRMAPSKDMPRNHWQGNVPSQRKAHILQVHLVVGHYVCTCACMTCGMSTSDDRSEIPVCW